MPRKAAFLPLLALGLAAGALAAPRPAPIGTPIGEPRSCVPLQQIYETRVRDDSTIDFVLRDRTVLRNTLPHSCPQLGFEQAFSYATSLSRLCSVDIITVIHRDQATRGVSCGLGQFQPVTLTTAAR